MDRILYSKDNIEVRQGGGIRSLWLNGACMGRAEANRPNVAVSQYIKETVAKVECYSNVLCIGLGAGLAQSWLRRMGCVVMTIEPNLDMYKVASQYFGYKGSGFDILNKAELVTDVPQGYQDYVILDAYNDNTPVPELYNEEFYSRFKTSHLIVNEVKNGWNHIWQRSPQ